MGEDMMPEPLQQFQRRIQSFFNWAVTEAEQRVGRFVDGLHPMVVLGVCGASIVALYAHVYFALPWELCRHLVMDTIAVLLLTFALATFSRTVGDIRDYLGYRDLRAALHVWHGRRYYEYVRTTRLTRPARCLDVGKDGEIEINPWK